MKNMENRICKKCLLRELQGQDFQNVYDYIESLDEDIKTPKEEYERRLSVCKECERLISGMCNACGCFVEMRAAVNAKACPYHHW